MKVVQHQTEVIGFDLIEFNQRRHSRGAPAARVSITESDGHTYWLWMDAKDLAANIKLYGPAPALVSAKEMYAK